MGDELYIDVYRRFCKLAATNDDVFKTFKRHENYIPMLEHVNYAQGLEYLNIIQKQNPSLLAHLPKFMENDSLGSPNTEEYTGIGKISPTTLRYIKILSDMIEMFESLENQSIIEVGGGYGGQCKIISDVFRYKDYTIVDLPEVVSLINRCFVANKVPSAKAITLDGLTDSKWDLFISNYAFTELSADLQRVYIERVINNCEHGYIICNFCGNPANATSLTKELIFKEIKHKLIELDEFPKTHPNNCLLVW